WRQHRDHMKRHAIAAQPADTGNRAVKGAASRSGTAIEVVETLRAIDRNTDADPFAEEKFAPGVVGQCAVGLERVIEHEIGRLQGLDLAEGAPVEIDRQYHRLTGMPDDADTLFRPARGKDLREQIAERRLGDNRLVAAIRQVAVTAIDIT